MKTSKRILSFLLALAVALSLAIPFATPVSAAGVDTYIASCTTYAASLQVKTTAETPLMTYPCTAATQSGSSVYETLAAGTTLYVTKLYRNTAGEYWYAVSHNLDTYYVRANHTALLEHLVGDVTIKNVQSPASLAYGSSFAIKGEISASQNKLGTVSAAMHLNTDITREPAMVATDTPTGNTYSLQGSAIDYALVFGNLAAGVYTYVVTADAISYYIDSNGTLSTTTRTVVLDTQECVITDWRNPNDALAYGIDVSTWQGSIDWSRTKNEIDFAILRIGYSTTLDNRFLEYAENCEKYGIPYGVYHYSYGLSVAEVTAEAQFVIDTLRAYGYNPELGVWYDMEDASQAALSTSVKESFVMAFCDTIAEAGYRPGFYGFTSWFSSSFQKGYLASMPQWIAQIDGFSSNGTATYDGGTWLWQYSWEGSFSGIYGDVDCNICYADFSVFNSDNSYLSQCTQYPARAMAKTTDTVNLRQYPSTGNTSLGSLAANTPLEVTGLYQNTSGEYWYQVVNGNQAGYVHSDYVTITEFLYDDLAVIEPTMASNLNVGSGYYLRGELVSKWNTIHTTYAKVYSGEDTQANPLLTSSYANNSKHYNLYRSAVCNQLVFGMLAEGYYTYEISADVKNYYVDNGTLTSETENVVVWAAPFTVGNPTLCNPHAYGSWTVTKAATCTEEGSKYRICSNCSHKEVATIPASSHSYTTVTTPATCTEYAKTTYTCTACGHHYEAIAGTASDWSTTKPTGVAESLIETKTQYRYSDKSTTTSSSATLDGYTLESSAWDSGTAGSIQYVKSWPSGFSTSHSLYSTYKKTPKTASETANTKVTINSNTVTGYLYYHWCYTDSYYSVESNQGSYTTFHAFYSTQKPSECENYDSTDGSYYFPNTSCCTNGDWYWYAEVNTQKYTTYNKIYTHAKWSDWSEWSDTAVTATDTRKVESRTLYRYVDAKLGDHSYTTVVTAPTCTEDGYTTYTCSVCGDSYVSDKTSVVDHNYQNGKCTWCGTAEPVTELDYYLIGYINGVDYGCEGDAANMGEYKFVDGSLTATFQQDSYVFIKTTNNTSWYMTDGWLGKETTTATLYNTAKLGENADKLYVPGGVEVTFTLVVNDDDTLTLTYTTPTVEIDPFTISLAQVELGNALNLNFLFLADSWDDWTGCYAVLTKTYADGRDNVTVTVPADQWEDKPSGGKQYKRIGFHNISAKEMADEISIVVYNADGVAISNQHSDSIVSYLERMLGKNSNAEFRTLAVDMLNYGAAAQTQFNYNLDNLANANIGDYQQYGTATDAVCVNNQVKGNNVRGASVSLENNIIMNVYFTNQTADMTAEVTFKNHAGTDMTVVLTSVDTPNGYCFQIDKLAVADMRTMVTITCKDADGNVYGTLTDSVEGYVARTGLTKAINQAIMKFSDSAYAYLH